MAAFGSLAGADRGSLLDLSLGSMASRLQWFWNDPLHKACRIALIQSPGTSWVIVVPIVALLTAYFFGVSGSRGARLTKVLCLPALTLLSYLPNLIVAEQWASFRTLGPLTLLLGFLYLIALRTAWTRLVFRPHSGRSIALALAGAVAFGFCQYRVTSYFAVPQSIEWRIYRDRLGDFDPQFHQRIEFVQPAGGSLGPRVRMDEFGVISTSRPWVPAGLIRFALTEHGLDASPPVVLIPP